MFVLQSWAMARTPRQMVALASRAPLRRRHALGLAFIAYGLIYPALAWADGLRYPYAPTFGVPCPTTILTIGFLLASPTRSILESIVPIAWSVIGGSASWLFGVHADVALVAAGLVLAVDLVGTARLETGVMS
jgi:hypothetical protein